VIDAVAFRVDASPAIGIGHLMRCLTLADVLARRGARTLFISRHLPPHLQSLVEGRGHALARLDSAPALTESDPVPHAAWLGTTQTADAADTRRALAGGSWTWMVVDHYALDHRWETIVRSSAGRLCAIDDVADRDHDSDVLMDQNLYPAMETRYAGKVPAGSTQLLGPRFALLRPEFARLRAQSAPRTGAVKRIMVLLGGMDAHNHTAKVVQALGRIEGRQFEVDVVIGYQHPAADEVRHLCDAHGYRLHVQLQDVAAMMAASDLAIGASGSTSWERCALGLPTVCLTHADNQVAIADGLASAGAVLNLGDGNQLSEGDIAVAIGRLVSEPSHVRVMSVAAWGITDGRGADRVADVLAGVPTAEQELYT